MNQETIKGTWTPDACAAKMEAVHGNAVSKAGAAFMAKINPNPEVSAFWRKVADILNSRQAVPHV